MPRLAQIAPALIGLALAAPATAQAQSHAHSASGCSACEQARHGTPVVHERRGPLARMMGGDRVTIPAGHHVAEPRGNVPGPVASHDGSAPFAPSSGGWDAGYDATAGHASIGPNDAMPYAGIGTVGAGEPLPIGEMRTNFVPPMAPSAPSSPAAAGGFGGVPVIPPDPAIQMWHQARMTDRVANRRSGPMETMLGTAGLNNWLESRRTMRAMRASAKKGMYAPSLHEMPSWAVNGGR